IIILLQKLSTPLAFIIIGKLMNSTHKPFATVGLVLVLVLGVVLLYQLATSPVAVVPCSQTAQVSAPTSGLVSYWNLDGNGTDNVGGKNGTPSTGGSVSYVDGKVGRALAVSGGGYLGVSNPFSTSAGT